MANYAQIPSIFNLNKTLLFTNYPLIQLLNNWDLQLHYLLSIHYNSKAAITLYNWLLNFKLFNNIKLILIMTFKHM
jgi:hypothetical protein